MVEIKVRRSTTSRTNSGEVKRRHLLKTIHVVVELQLAGLEQELVDLM